MVVRWRRLPSAETLLFGVAAGWQQRSSCRFPSCGFAELSEGLLGGLLPSGAQQGRRRQGGEGEGGCGVGFGGWELPLASSTWNGGWRTLACRPMGAEEEDVLFPWWRRRRRRRSSLRPRKRRRSSSQVRTEQRHGTRLSASLVCRVHGPRGMSVQTYVRSPAHRATFFSLLLCFFY